MSVEELPFKTKTPSVSCENSGGNVREKASNFKCTSVSPSAAAEGVSSQRRAKVLCHVQRAPNPTLYVLLDPVPSHSRIMLDTTMSQVSIHIFFTHPSCSFQLRVAYMVSLPSTVSPQQPCEDRIVTGPR